VSAPPERKAPLTDLTFGKLCSKVALYIGLALAALTVFVLCFALTVHLGIEDKIGGRWIGFVGYTAILFGVIIRHSKRLWDRCNFWLVVAALLTIHCLAFVVILSKRIHNGG
jgi:uncharacterized membrane protein HdeD (DUF308 family)